MSTSNVVSPVLPTSRTIADAVKAQVKTYGATVAMIKAVYAAEGMACGPTLADVVAILLDPKRSHGSQSDRVTFYETFRKTSQRAIGDDCLLPPIFLLDKKDNTCRVVMLAKDVTIEQVKAAMLPTREENKALTAIMVRDKVPAPKVESDEPEATDKSATETDSETDSEPAPTEAATDFDKLVALLSTMDAEQIRLLVGAVGETNPAQLVTLADSVNTALKAAHKQSDAVAQLTAYKSAGAAPSTMAQVPTTATEAATSVPENNVVAAAMTKAKPTRKGNKRAAKRAA